ncbi:MAG: hypothetical protein AM325_015745 [Candidatus Thorarchaeota archaeon SMTZ1-45]
MAKYECPCGERVAYGMSYDEEKDGSRVYWTGSCCDGGSGMGCASSYGIRFCPFCARPLPKAKKVKEDG